MPPTRFDSVGCLGCLDKTGLAAVTPARRADPTSFPLPTAARPPPAACRSFPPCPPPLAPLPPPPLRNCSWDDSAQGWCEYFPAVINDEGLTYYETSE